MRTDELDLVRRFAQDGPEPPADVMDRARQRLTEAMATSAEVVPLITSSNKALDRRRRRFVLPAVVAAAVLALAGVVVGVTISGGGARGRAPGSGSIAGHWPRRNSIGQLASSPMTRPRCLGPASTCTPRPTVQLSWLSTPPATSPRLT